MDIKAKHLVFGIAVLGLGAVYVNDRVKTLSEIMVKLIPIPSGLRNYSFNNWILSFNFDVTIHNPTSVDFNPNGLIVTVKRLEIKERSGKLIAKVDINKNSINIPARSKYVLKNLAVKIDTYANLLNAPNLMKIKSINDVKIDVVLSILGTEHIIPQL
jgi:hypothetical protein